MTYRDDLQAARMRRDALNRELQQVRSRAEEYQALLRREQELAQELAQCARDLDQARARVELPLLQQVRVASPCKERWDGMTGDEHVRHCGRCEKNVYDLSALTASQAEALLRERGESMCVRFFRRSDGTILTSDCPVGGKRKRFWRRVTTAAVTSGLAAAGITLAPATLTFTKGDMAPMQSDAGEYFAGGLVESLPRGVGGMEPLPTEMEKRNQRIANIEAELMAATEERGALEQELEDLNAEVRRLREIGQHERRVEIFNACRKNPVDC